MFKLLNKIISLCLVSIFSFYTPSSLAIPLTQLQLPPGFHISIYAVVPNARSMTLDERGIVYVGSLHNQKVYALLPAPNYTHAQKVLVVKDNLDNPNGVTYVNGDLYVAEKNRILQFKDIYKQLISQQIQSTVAVNDIPSKGFMHSWHYLKNGPDGWLYYSIGFPCNSCLPDDPQYGTIMRFHPPDNNPEIFASGIRNSVGLDWHPLTHQLWFTDNGRDWMGDDFPPDELNYADRSGLHFGFPFYNGTVLDKEFGHLKNNNINYVFPALELGPHVAALGMTFYNGNMFPIQYQKQLFIAEHGSWNRSRKSGYRISLVTFTQNKPTSYQSFITGWLQGQEAWGRPVDLLVMPDGSLLISDDYSGVIYRVTWSASTP